MGVRFACHHCGKALNIKQELAGKRGVCPACAGKFRIPLQNETTSLAIDAKLTASRTPSTTSPAQKQSHPDGIEVKTKESLPVEQTASSPLNEAPIEKTSRMVGQKVLAPSPKQTAEALESFAPDSSWYVRPPGGGQYGPATKEVFAQWIQEGRIAAASLVWRDGWPQWRPASEAFPEITGQLPGGEQVQPQSTNNHPSQDALGTDTLRTDTLRTGAEKVHKLVQPASQQQVVGDTQLGKGSRERSTRRIMSIAALAAVAIALVGALVFITQQS
ncbi:DUF4339 domain-containing protein [Rhodopirellula sp.]|nr:DUF4339 domain-containing protein [Rhodopirellula sp.]MDB4678753.1 DUF4339 domain-containing protein [Rhodopirellula sp.]MDB4809831.1 DUF4339 domain-containing protein [bacterium]